MSANLVTVDEESLRKDIMNLVRKPVNETLNGLLDEGSSELVGAGHHEGTAGLGYRVTVRFKLIALIYESIISSLSKKAVLTRVAYGPRVLRKGGYPSWDGRLSFVKVPQ